MKSKQNLAVFFTLFVLISSALIGLLMKDWNIKNAIVPFFVMLIISTTLGLMAMYIVHKTTNLTSEQLRKRIIFYLIGFYASTYLISNITITIVTYFAYLTKGRDMNTFIPNLFKYELSAGNNNLHFWLMLFTTVFFYYLWIKTVKKEAKLKEEKLKYQYQTLKSKVNPHFLFNSLNVLSEMVYDDAKKADEYIQELSKVYRYVLENNNTQMIDLDKELEFVKKYFDLQNQRSEGKVFLKIKVQKENNYQIVPVASQILVENAFKHNKATKESPLNIHIYLQNNNLIVENNLQRKITMESSTKQGLENLDNIVKLKLNQNIKVEETRTKYKVTLPMLMK